MTDTESRWALVACYFTAVSALMFLLDGLGVAWPLVWAVAIVAAARLFWWAVG